MNASVDAYIRDNLRKTIRSCTETKGTLLGLPFPYTVPCIGEMFQELYYWDTYFFNVGLLTCGETAVAKNNVDNMLHLVNTYGFMPNGNRTYYLNRSQPPFLSRMVKELYAVTKDVEWLLTAYETLKKEYDFWQTQKRSPSGLNAYTGYEVRDEDLDLLYGHFIKRTGYVPDVDPSDERKRDICQAVFSFFESGWDCNSRFLCDGHRIDAVDLNSLLYDMEQNMASFACELQNGEETLWRGRAAVRRELMNTFLWDETRGLFLDHNTKTGQKSAYRSAASFYPLFVGAATPAQAALTWRLLSELERPYGVAAGEENGPWHCQWDYPNVWAPLQFITYHALVRYGYERDARRVAQKYVWLVEHNFEKTGNLWEKYNAVTGEIASDEYDAPPMMGWTAGVYLHFCRELEKTE